MDDILHCGRYRLSLKRPLIMGIVNLTDDSFSGDGLGGNYAKAVEQGYRLLDEGADLLDIGAESARPGSAPVPVQQEVDRLLPVLEGLLECNVPLSVDTTKPEVMVAALSAGADMINDICALEAPGALAAVAGSQAAVCLMHMQGKPRTMQRAPSYLDVVVEVEEYLAGRVAATRAAGIPLTRIVVDPGFGFGKTLAHNLALLRHLDKLRVSGLPLLAGLSRKSMLGLLTGRSEQDRVYASVAAALLAAQNGARILRVHDVAATRDALTVWNALEEVSE